MGDFFLKLMNMSIAAGWLILAVLLLRLLLKRAPRWIACLLWGIVAVRLICPVSVESALSLIPSAETVRSGVMEEGEFRSNIPSIDSRLPVVRNRVNPFLQEAFAYEEDSGAPMLTVSAAAGTVWCFGALCMAVYALAGHLRIRRMVAEAARYGDGVYLCDGVASPFIAGIVRPRIYLPSGMDMGRLPYVIAHEQAHLQRRDHWWKPLGYLLLCMHWFNPLCWAAYRLFCRDIEFACDEKVIRNMDFEEKKEYSKALLSCSGQGRTVLTCPLAFGEVGVRERVKSVLAFKKAAFWLFAAAIAVCAIVAVCFLTDPPREYQIGITVPAGFQGEFVYSDEEISPKGGPLVLYAGEGLGDTEIVLVSGEGEGGYAFGPEYLTPGMPVKFEAEKGTWYRIGVNVQNSSDRDEVVYVSAKNVEVRIARQTEDGGNGEHGKDGGEQPQPPDGPEGKNGETSDESESQRYGMGDLDQNGVEEYLLLSPTEHNAIDDGHLSFYFNGESIYEYEDSLRIYPGTAEYIDLDGDGEEEIFFTFYPAVNSMPLVEYAVLKRTGGGWEPLEMIHGEDMPDNAFPVSCKYGEEKNTLVISCEGTDRQILYNFEAYYEDCIETGRRDGANTKEYEEILYQNRYEPGQEFGGVAAWGIWEITSGTWEGVNCLIATHGLEGPLGKWDLMGTVDIYFHYNARGRVEILDMKFWESLSRDGRADSEAVCEIIVTNGDNGNTLSYSVLDSSNGFRDLLALYEQLDFAGEKRENTRVGYKYRMTLYDVEGEVLCTVTPYKDGFAVDRSFYACEGSVEDQASVALMNYMELLFYPADGN